MKSKDAAPVIMVPRFLGRGESDMVARGMERQLDLFREIVTPQAKLQVMAMMALSNPKQLDQPQRARVADIAKAMGYQPDESGKLAGSLFDDIIKNGWKLKTSNFDVPVREPTGKRAKNGRRLYRVGIRTLSIFQEFMRYYEDGDGQPISWDDIPKKDIKAVPDEPPIYVIPLEDENGNVMKQKDGKIRTRNASGLEWRFLTSFAEMARNKETAWVFYMDAILILRRYLSRPVALNLMLLTLFHKDDYIEFGHEKLISHLGILGKDAGQVNAAIDAAFKAAFDEGIIDRPVQVKKAGYYKKTKKTGRERRKGTVYQWSRAARWRIGKSLPMVPVDLRIEAYNEGENEKPKS